MVSRFKRIYSIEKLIFKGPWKIDYNDHKNMNNKKRKLTALIPPKLWLLGDSIHESSTIEPKFNEINFHFVIIQINIIMLYVKWRKT